MSALFLVKTLAGPDFLSMRRVFVSYSQPIRFVRFDGKSVNHGLAVLDPLRGRDSWCLQEPNGLLVLTKRSGASEDKNVQKLND